MSFTPKSWVDGDPSTPLDAAGLVDLEERLAGYADSRVPVFNVKDFGATGDGETDDTAAIQAALDEVGPGGAIVHVPAGVYLVNLQERDAGIWSALEIAASNTVMRGEGRESCIKLADGQPTDTELYAPVLRAGSKNNIVITDLAVDGNKANQAIESMGENGLGWEGITFGSSSGSTISRCFVQNCAGDGVDLDSCTNAVVAHNKVAACDGSGIHISNGCKDVTVGCNVTVGNGARTSRHGMDAASGTVNILFTGNISKGDFRGWNDNGAGNAFVGNSIRDAIQNGIRVNSTGPTLVAGNRIDGVSGGEGTGALDGIFVTGSSEALVTGNVVANADRFAIHVHTGDAVVCDNHLSSLGSAVVQIVTACVVRGNKVDCPGSETQDGISITSGGGGTVCTENVVNSAPRYGVRGANTTGSLVLRDNVINQSGSNGIRLELASDSSYSADVAGNLIVGAGGSGAISVLSQKVSIRGNRTLDTSGQSSVRLDSGAEDIFIAENLCDKDIFNTSATNVDVLRNVASSLSHPANARIMGGNILGGLPQANRGSAAVSDTETTEVVTHGLLAEPTSVIVTPHADEHVWVSARSSTTFTVSRSGSSGELAFDWQAEV